MGCSCCGQQALRDLIPGKAREIAKALLTHLRRQGGTLNKSLDSRRDIGGIGVGHKNNLLVPQESGRVSRIPAPNHPLLAPPCLPRDLPPNPRPPPTKHT